MAKVQGSVGITLPERIVEAREAARRDAAQGRCLLEQVEEERHSSGAKLDAEDWIVLAGGWIDCGLYGRALSAAQCAVKLGAEQGDSIRESIGWQLTSVIHWRELEIELALTSLERAKDLAQQSEYRADLHAVICETEALIRQNTSEFELAVKASIRSREHWMRTGDEFKIGRNALNLSCLHEQMGNFPAALEAGLEARKAIDPVKYSRSCAILALNLAIVQFRMGDTDAAHAEAQAALLARDSVGRTDFHLSVEAIYAEICLAAGDQAGALSHAAVIEDTPDEAFTKVGRINQLDAAANIFLGLHEFERGLACVDRALAPSDLTENQSAVTSALLTKVELYLEMERIEEARELLPSIFRLQGDNHSSKHQRRLLSAASRAAEAVGDLFQALAYERSLCGSIRKVEKERAARQVESLRVTHHAERARLKRESLERSQAELEVRVEQRTLELSRAYLDLEQETRDRENSERERRELAVQLQRIQSTESLARLAGGVAHDFNNLLTVVGGCAELIGQQLPQESEIQQHIRELDLAVEHGIGLTRRLVGFGGQPASDLGPVAAQDLLLNVQFFLEHLIADDLSLSIEATAQNVHVQVVPPLFDSVLMNLALNARDSMPRGGDLTISTRVEHDQDGASFVVSVRDTGTGISQELQDRIFEPYFTTKAAGKGTGLGLSSARGSITEMGGELLLVDSSPEGSCFEVRLAVVDEKASLPQQALARPVETAFEGRSVLLVEDDESVRDLLSALLVHLGFEVSTASDGQAGLEHMQSLLQDQTPPDVLVCDVQMPRMGGPEMLSELERDGCEIPTLLVSGWHRYTEAELLAGYSGPMRFLSKPVGLRGLQDALADLLF